MKTVNDNILFDTADLFKIFSDSTRIRILYSLYDSEKNVSEIVSELGMQQSTISHQLIILKKSKLIKNRREGKIIYYSLDDEHVKSIINQGIEHAQEKKR